MKGISPLIATILLIAFAVAVGGLISVWLSNLTGSQTTTVQSASDTLTKCASTTVQINSVRYLASWNPRVANVTIEAGGTQVLKNVTFTVAGAGNSLTTYKYFNGTGDDFLPGTAFSTTINSSNITVAPELVSVNVFCGTRSITSECLAGQSCMVPVS